MSARRWLGIVILGVCLGGPIAEAFDWWDQALPVGNDTEASVVVVALSLGLALAVAPIVVRSFQSLSRSVSYHRRLIRPVLTSMGTFAQPWATSRPPSPLRI